MKRHARVVLLALVVPVSIVLLLVVTPPLEDFGLDSDRWTGLSEASSELHATAVWSLASLDGYSTPSTLLVLPREPFLRNDIWKVEQFVKRGGTLILMDDFGYGNELLSGLGVDIALAGGCVLDPIVCSVNETMPRVSVALPDRADTVRTLQLNHASWLVAGENVDVLGRSSRFSFGDVDHDGRKSADEPSGPLPIAATCALGDGRVIVVSDSSIVINGMVGIEGNVSFLQAVADGPVLVAATHLPSSGTDSGKRFVASLRAGLRSVAGVTIAIVLALTVALLYPWYNPGRRYAN